MLNILYIPQENVILPLLHVKLVLMRKFGETMDENGDECLYLKSVFPNKEMLR